MLGEEVRARLVAVLAGYAATARANGATQIAFVGTDPLRRAADAARVIHAVDRACGVPLHVLSHEEEALLTIVGVLDGRRVERPTLILDIGGGSTELCLAEGHGHRPRVVGLPLGAGTLVDELVSHDPPNAGEQHRLSAAAREALSAAPDVTLVDVVAVGGTASNLRRIVAQPQDDSTLTRDQIAAAVEELAGSPSETIASRHGLNPARARVLPGGAAILDAVMDRYGLQAIRISDVGIREGVIRALARHAWAWRDALPDLASGRRD
jgi:exopolyphosphatase/guanosine-5'-triphosphate,3'-diphosphate pyrophosphatase